MPGPRAFDAPMSVATGLIGAGAFGANHAAKLASLPQSRFQGVYDADHTRAEAAAVRHGARAFTSLDELLSVTEAVIVATPARTHAAVAGAALAAGKHVLVEKPLAASTSEANALVAAARAKSLVLQTGHQERLVLQALGLLSAPERPTRADITRETSFTGRSMDVSVTFDLMIHDLDLVALLFGQPTAVEAQGHAERGVELDDVEARITFAKGEARLHASRIAEARKRTLHVEYPSGIVEIDMLTHALTNTTSFPLDANFAKKATDPLLQAVAAFLDAVISGGASTISGEDGAAAVALAEAVDRAAKR